MTKLTAKLSDGTEWEVLSYRGQAFGKRDGISYKDETIGLELKPLKNGPPKEVFLELPGEKEFQHIRSYSFDSTTTGGKYTRYVLADEKKEPREWWEVICPCDPNIVNSFTSREKAESFMQYFGASSNTYEIVHVREVVE